MSRKKRKPPAKPAAPETPSTAAESPWTREDWIWLALSLAFSAIVYLYTMWPSMAGGDSGELTTAAYTLGIVHPPGYPLFTMLGHLFTYLPFGTVAYRVNLLSVVCGLGAQALLFLTLMRITRKSWLAAALTLMFAFSVLTWRYSIQAEVFALNNLFAAALLYGFIRVLQTREAKPLFLLSFIFGLGLSNHHTLVFIGAPVGLYLLWFMRERLRPVSVLALFGLFFAGLLPYYYLFWASERIPLVSWGEITSWDGFMTHLLRKEYGTFKLATEGSNEHPLFWGLVYFAENVAETVLYLGVIPVLAGVYVLLKKRTEAAMNPLLLIMPALYLVVFHSLANLPFVDGAALYKDIVSRFWLMANLLLMPVTAFGVLYLLAHERVKPFAATLKYFLLALPLAGLALNFRTENHRDNYTFAEFGRHLLRNLPRNAVYFSLGDINTNSIRYVQNCEGFRADVKVLDRSLMSYNWFKRIANKHYPDVTLPGQAYHPTAKGSFDFKKLIAANFDRHQIYMTSPKLKDSNEAFDKGWENHYQLVPYGLTQKVNLKNSPVQIDEYIKESEKYLVDPIALFPRKPLPDSWDNVIQANYWLAHHTRAAEILRYALRTQDKAYFLIAEKLLEDLVVKNQSPPADYFKNLGIAHQHLAKLSDGADKQKHETRMLEVWEAYVRKTDRRDKTYDDIRSVLKAYGRLKS